VSLAHTPPPTQRRRNDRPGRRCPPACLRALVQERLGQRVDEAVPGRQVHRRLRQRLLLADGSRVFVKAASRLRSPEVFSSYQQEIRVARGLPEDVPAPRLRWALEQEEALVLAFEDIAGRTRSALGALRSCAPSWTCSPGLPPR
jgi:hypothetical protein